MTHKKERHKNKPKLRNTRGSMFVLVICILCVLLLLLGPLILQICRFSIARDQNLSAADAASLAAAQELSRIVIVDPHFGYIGLSDHPPSGKFTLARDGEPLPVLGINTITGTARLDLIIADRLENENLRTLAIADAREAQRAQQLLCQSLTKALQGNGKDEFYDADGNRVKPYESAKDVYMRNLAAMHVRNHVSLKNFKLSLGWLKTGGTTLTPVPQPDNLAAVPCGSQLSGTYLPFKDIPYGDQNFSFAALSQQPALVHPANFIDDDGKHACSIIKVQAQVVVSPMEGGASGDCSDALSCAQCCALPDMTPPGAMLLSFPDGPVPSLKSMRDMLSEPQLVREPLKTFTAYGGDYPNDPQAILKENSSRETVARVFAQGLYDWIRAARLYPRVDSLMRAIDTQFASLPENSTDKPLLLDFDSKGEVTIDRLSYSPFASQTVNEGQAYVLSFNAIKCGDLHWTLLYRDQVNRLGLADGGKHAGQIMVGNPVNWCELPAYAGSLDSAKQRARGGQVLGLEAGGDTIAAGGSYGVSATNAVFHSTKGSTLAVQPRKSLYSGGLAVEFVISSPSDDAE